jgi:cell wall-associated NlpC family hydrolase
VPVSTGTPALLPRRLAQSVASAPIQRDDARRSAGADSFAGYFASASVGVSARMKQSPIGTSSSGAATTISGSAVLSSGSRYLGAPYQMGAGRGSGPVDRIDCSAFVARAYSDATGRRVKLIPYTDAMYAQTGPVGADGPQPGDLVFYRGVDSSQPGTRYPHVALYVGPGRVLDASSVAGKVSYRALASGSGYSIEYRRVAA